MVRKPSSGLLSCLRNKSRSESAKPERNLAGMDEKLVKFYVAQIVLVLEYLHKSGVCHRDLKPENLLLDYDNTLKIVDFGLSNMYEKNETLKTACGSPCYAAPEVSLVKISPFSLCSAGMRALTNIDFINIDDRWQALSRPANRHLVKRCRFLRYGRRLPAL